MVNGIYGDNKTIPLHVDFSLFLSIKFPAHKTNTKQVKQTENKNGQLALLSEHIFYFVMRDTCFFQGTLQNCHSICGSLPGTQAPTLSYHIKKEIEDLQDESKRKQ